MGKYDDIINISYPNPEIEQDFPDRVLREAQFAPFAALTGFDEELEETARLADKKMILDDGVKEELNRKLIYLKDNLDTLPKITLMYFVKDSKKDGGKYVTKTGRIKNIRVYEGDMVFSDGNAVKFSDIVSVESDLFS